MAAVALQLKVAIHVIEDWLKRIASDKHPQLPDEIVILPADFNFATQRAHSIDPIAAENMGAAALYVSEAETNLEILRTVAPGSPEAKEVQERAAKSLNTAKYKLSVARTRWEALARPAVLTAGTAAAHNYGLGSTLAFRMKALSSTFPPEKGSLAEFRPPEQGDFQMTEEANKRIGDYQILDELGSGGMGRVWRVRNVITDRIEAMKVLLPDLAGRQELAARFQREIKLMASLNHPNIAALRTAFTADNQLYMVMEYVEGTNLADKLEKGPIAVGDAVNYISQVLSAVSYAHQQHIIHRDIKPANMMLTPQGVIKLMDFGIARAGEERSLTMTGTTMGSLSYMSPEQVKGEATDARSDLYSVGVSLYEFVTGQRPFTATSDYSIMAAHVKEAPKPPVELHPGLPAALNEIILMAIAKDPAQRFQTADAFRNALSSVPVAAPTPAMLEATTVDSMAALPNVPAAPAATPARPVSAP